MGAAQNVIPLEEILEEEAKKLQAPHTQVEALVRTKASGVDVSTANKIIGLLYNVPSTVCDREIRLPHGVEVPLLGSSIVLPPGMMVGEQGRICRNGVPLSDAELGGTTLTGGLCECQLEDGLNGKHQSVSPVVCYLKLCGNVTSIAGHVWSDSKSKRKSAPSLKLYLTGKPFIIEDYRKAATRCKLLVGSTPELREWLESDDERIQNVASELLFKLMAHNIKDIDGLVAERDMLKALCNEKYKELELQFQNDLCFRHALIREMAVMSNDLRASQQARQLNLAGQNAAYFDAVEDNVVLLKTYRQMLKLRILQAI